MGTAADLLADQLEEANGTIQTLTDEIERLRRYLPWTEHYELEDGEAEDLPIPRLELVWTDGSPCMPLGLSRLCDSEFEDYEYDEASAATLCEAAGWPS